MTHLHLNFVAIFACAVGLWLIGAVWYSPALFARTWIALVGMQPASAKKNSLIVGMISSFLGDVLVAFVLDHIVLWSGARTFAAGAVIGCVAWVGFFAATMFPQGVYEGRPFKLFLINGGYWFLGLFLVGGTLAAWR